MSLLRILRSLLVMGCTCIALLTFTAAANAQQYNPLNGPVQGEDAGQAPGRVARLAYLSGQVQFAPAGESDWGSVEVNRPMVIGDRLLTGDDGRATLELGDAAVRIDHGSAFDFLNLDENNVQIELSQGTLNLAVRDLADGENFEVDTPTIAFVATAPGTYRIDNSPTGTGSMVTVFRGSGIVYGENGASREVAPGSSYRFNDSMLTSVDTNGLPEPDDFDRFCETRDANYANYTEQQRQYIPPDMIGGDDLYQYGQWNDVPEYGNVWYPRSVPVGWAPYRYGHWAWIDPWGWTWVDNQPWGFAPFHYGRWVYARNRWGWLPGPANVRPVYAPALVAFVGGSGASLSIRVGGGGPVGWFPLGPRDVYVPWFHASRGYFTNVNVTNIRNVYVNRRAINNFYDDYRDQRYSDIHRRNHYRNRDLPGAVTMVPRTIFANARPVHPAALKLDSRQLRNMHVAVRPDVNPGKASLGLHRPAARPAVLHGGREPFARPVVARHAPPPRPVDFAAREKIIARQHGQPLSEEQLRNLGKAQPARAASERRVKLVAAAPGKATRPATIKAAPRRDSTAAQPAHRDVSPRTTKASGRVASDAHPPPFKNTVHPIPAQPRPSRQAPLRAGELPSARFRSPERTATLPRPATIRPAPQQKDQHAPAAAGRLPVVRPLRPASRSQPRPDTQAQSRARIVRPQPQQQRQEQAQQQVRAQQVRQRSAAATQQRAQQQQMARQRAAQTQMQRQRETQARSPQPVRAPPVQQQRQVQQMRAQQVQQAQREARQPAVQRPQEHYAPRATPQHPPARERQERPSKKHPDSSGHTQIH
ncbi:MAG: DUF6600 domain-containing protein [Rhodanobacteraceae bacterium]